MNALKLSLIQALAEKDRYTAIHCVQVAALSRAIAEELGTFLAIELELLYTASLLHDVGKIGTPEHILFKPSSLSTEEWACMQDHSTIGQRIVEASDLPNSNLVGGIIRHTHENFDGTGYPDALMGVSIPYLARIIAVADCFDALTHRRPYRDSLGENEAVAMIKSEAGRKYDPEVVSVLESALTRAMYNSDITYLFMQE